MFKKHSSFSLFESIRVTATPKEATDKVLKTKVPISLLTEEGLSYVASGVGKPLYADQATEEMGMINFYRVCIEVETEAACPQVLEVFTDDKNLVDVESKLRDSRLACTTGHSIDSSHRAFDYSKMSPHGSDIFHPTSRSWATTSRPLFTSEAATSSVTPDIVSSSSLITTRSQCSKKSWMKHSISFEKMVRRRDFLEHHDCRHALNGYMNEAMRAMDDIEVAGVRPNVVTFIIVLPACSHGGLVDDGFMILELMVKKY
ncbi:hypothetical protein L2E82_16873 [Cichorium intybus]|uniref:Uncharacterized protein n=1 Tax=Cichorium intybus TaxID=13427 RepID=A0ACB9F6R4_CICIN|nr:hypothetical protein L2E82_16873 [Cichorium intybus]